MDKIDYLLYEFDKGRGYSEIGKKTLKKAIVIFGGMLIFCVLMFIYPKYTVSFMLAAFLLMIAMYLLTLELEGKIGTKERIQAVNKSRREHFQEEQKRLMECINSQGLQAQSVYNILKERQLWHKEEKHFIKITVPSILSAIGVLLKPIENSGEQGWPQYVALFITLFFFFSSVGWNINNTFGKLNVPIKSWYWQKYEGDRVLEYLQDMLYL